MRYSIDTSALIGMWVRYYPPEVFPGLWERFEELISAAEACASRSVKQELERQDDDLSHWSKDQTDFFVEHLDDCQQQVSAFYKGWPDDQVDWNKRLLGADLFVIARAQLDETTVVSDEKPSNSTRAPKIPDACKELGVRHLSPVQFLKELGWTF